MASFTVSALGSPTGSGEKTLAGTTADTVTISPRDARWRVEILNLSTSQALDFRADGSTAVSGAAGTIRIPAGGSVAWPTNWVHSGSTISVVGNSNLYQVNVIPG